MKKQKGRRNQHNGARKKAKRHAVVAAKKKEQATGPLSPSHRARAAALSFGVSYCMMTRDLFDIGIGHVIVGRTISPNTVATGCFLVDVYCLGTKDAFYAERTHEQLQELIEGMTGHAPFIDIAPECARKIVDGAIAYAKELGFAPHSDYAPAEALFGDIDARVCQTGYEFGKAGQAIIRSRPE